ncbi:hypothetical protein Tco_0559931 [Tanacetum coccineum]
MSDTNNNMQDQTSSALHNVIMEAGGNHRPPIVLDATPATPGNVGTPQQPREKIILTGIDNDIQMQWKCGKQLKELKTVSYHKFYDILKQHQNEVNEIRAERLVRTANPLALVAQQQQPVYNPQPNPTHYTKNSNPIHYTQSSSTRSQAATLNKGKAVANSPPPSYDQELEVVADDEASSKEKKIYKLMALISISFKKNYKPATNNLKTSSNTRNVNVDNPPRSDKRTGYSEQADWRDDTYDELEDQELEAHYMYMKKIQEVTPDAVHNYRPIFDAEPLQKVHNNDDDYNVFANERQHPKKPESVNDAYLVKQGDTNITLDLSDMSNNGEVADQDDQMI